MLTSVARTRFWIAGVIAIGAYASLTPARDARACSCLDPGVAWRLSASDLVFEGRVRSLVEQHEPPSMTNDHDRLARLFVARAWKGGEAGAALGGWTGGGGGGPFAGGGAHPVFSGEKGDDLAPTLCASAQDLGG